MDRSILINEQKVTNLVCEELKKSDIIKMLKNDNEFEKIIKTIVSDVIQEMFRVLWMHNNIFKTLSK